MIQGMIIKGVIKQVMKAIEKADDNRIARSHNKRLKALEKDSHPQADWVCMECGCNAKKVNKK
jgi:rubrerythrin